MIRMPVVPLIVVLALSGCAPRSPLTASFCAVANTESADGQQRLMEIVGDFAESHAMEERSSLPAIMHYVNSEVVLSLGFAIGQSRTEIAMFYENEDGAEMQRQFERYLAQRVQPEFGVIQCSDIPGYSPPQLGSGLF